VRLVRLGIEDEKSAGSFADPLHEAPVIRGANQLLDSIQRIDGAAAVAVVGLRPFVNHGEREVEIRGNLFGAGLLNDLAEEFVRLHTGTLEKAVGKFNPESKEAYSRSLSH
jgi:hypothetical protein